MSIKTYNQLPYVDDFQVENPTLGGTPESKNYLKILFKPGVSIQVREMNQLQSMLQSQIDRFGSWAFKDGQSVIDGEIQFNSDIQYFDIVLNSAEYSTYIDDITSLDDQSGVRAEILHAKLLSTDVGSVTYRFFVRFINSVQNGDVNVSSFSNGATLLATKDIGDSNSLLVNNGSPVGTISASGFAAYGTVASGVFFIDGHFVYAEESSIYVVKPFEDYLISGRFVFSVTDQIINSNQDRTLLDNATGESNYAAPGADRMSINLEFGFISDNDSSEDENNNQTGDDIEFIAANDIIDENSISNDSNYVTLLTISNSFSAIPVRDDVSDLEKTLSRRTDEESGSYTVEPFDIELREYLNDITDEENRGKYTPEQIRSLGIVVGENDISGLSQGTVLDSSASEATINTYAEARFVVGLEPSVAYVDGFRVERTDKTDVAVRKARSIKREQKVYTTAALGSYIIATSISSLPDLTSLAEATFYTADTASTVKCKIRGVEKVGSVFRIYLFDIQGAVELTFDNIRQGNFRCDLESTTIYDTQKNLSIYPLSYSMIENINDSDIEVSQRAKISATANESGQVSFSIVSGRFYEESGESYIAVDIDSGEVFPVVTNAVLSGAPSLNTVTLQLGASTNATDPANKNVEVMYSAKVSLTRKSKTLLSSTKTLSGTALQAGDSVSLGLKDVVSVEAFYYPGNNQSNPKTTISLQLDGGQRDGMYKTASVKYVPGVSVEGADVTVIAKYFSHSGTGSFYSRNSYSNTPYDEIPEYNGLRLSDSLDFRPDEGSSATVLDPNSVIEAIVDFYLPRKDKVVINKFNEIKVIEGISSLNPSAPQTPDGTLVLYILDIPAYTFEPSDIEIIYIDNKRYTMRDIGSLEKRIKNLEYYTSLSLLEREASGKQILDTSDGNPYDRFKNGIIVDSFTGHNVGNVFDPAYFCSIDAEEGILRSFFESKPINLKLAAGETSYGDLLTADLLSESAFVEQGLASVDVSVNPYAIATWNANIRLSPSSDTWWETKRAPDVIINDDSNLDALQDIIRATNSAGTQWNSWRTAWTGVVNSVTHRSRPHSVRAPDGVFRRRNVTVQTIQTNLLRTGIRTGAAIRTVSTEVDDKIIDRSFIPFIRPRKVYFRGKMFKPRTKLYVFFDGVDITKYATTSDFVEFKEGSNVTEYFNQSASTIVPSPQSLVTDELGEITGYFVIPNNAEEKFRTGRRKVLLSDSPNGLSNSTTTASADYVATGTIQTKQKTILSTRTVDFTQERVSETGVRITSNRNIRWDDPLAQTFLIGDISTGLYMTSIDLFFRRKSETLPLTIRIVSVENGIPTQKRLPFSTVIKNPDEVNISEDGTAVTNFAFESPVYIAPGIEYAIVVMSNDPEYSLWMAEVGGEDASTGQRISKNPYLGVSLKSQNASTWTPDQNKDFKFNLYRAKFDTSPREVIFETVGIDAENPIEFSHLELITTDIVHPETSLIYEVSADFGNNYFEISEDSPLYLSTTPGNEISSESQIKLKVTMSSNSDYISPIVDLDRISLLSIKNVISSEASVGDETLAGHGANEDTTRYITREVALEDPADQLDTYLLINRPSDTSGVKLFGRFKTTEDSIEDLPFVEIDPSIIIPVSSEGNYAEIRYTKAFEQFTSFQIKIIIFSDDHSLIPTIKDFRAIATT